MHILEKKLKAFSAAHRLLKGYQGKCRHLHGHNYQVSVTLQADQLDQYDLIIDFNEVKRLFDQWVQDHFDHATLVADFDFELLEFLQQHKQRHYVIAGNKNTSVEVLAHHLFQEFTRILSTHKGAAERGLRLLEVKLNETASSIGIYRQ
jgi:6-pyruvoyltetrahydropterin/6-carboxytetrahydropterin synthase